MNSLSDRNRAGLHSSARGYSLVELLVASSILAFAIVAIAATFTKSGAMQMNDRHYRMALSIMNSTLESAAYSSANYASLSNSSSTVVIDPRGSGTADDLTGTVQATVVADTVTTSTQMICKKITMTVTWNEPEGQQSVTVDRLVTP